MFPDGTMYNITLLEYDLLSATLLQRQLNGGTFLGEIIGNSLKYIVGDIPKERKMMLYSGDARNIAGILKNLDLWSPHIPKEAAALIFELYFDNETNIYGIKVTFFLFPSSIYHLEFLMFNFYDYSIQCLLLLFKNPIATNNFKQY